jgi:hypothetical protein
MALLTTYKIDVPWLMKECPVLWDVPCIMLHGDEIRVDGLPPNVMLRKPPVGVSYGVFHGKIMVMCSLRVLPLSSASYSFVPTCLSLPKNSVIKCN